MANDININNPANVLGTLQRGVSNTATSAANANDAERKTSDAQAPAGADRVSVTSEATRLQEIEEQLMAVPEVNSAKVAAIKAQIAAGTFDFNPQRVAEKLISFESGGK